MPTTEPAVKYEYNMTQKNWVSKSIQVQVDWTPWNEGSMRVVYQMKDLSRHAGDQECVAKLLKTPASPKAYFEEVEMQAVCKDLAHEFNKRKPPKKIDFILPYVIEFPHSGVFATVEKKLSGSYKKHTNNYGFVSAEDRNTPQAFSHFSWVQSGGKLLVCDIQGVGDVYTDPQIHSNEGPGIFKYGPGDIGVEGINKFFTTHRCNAICEFLCLPTGFMKKDIQSGTALAVGHSPSPFYSPNNSTNRLKTAGGIFGAKSGRRVSDLKLSSPTPTDNAAKGAPRTSPLHYKMGGGGGGGDFEAFSPLSPRMMLAF